MGNQLITRPAIDFISARDDSYTLKKTNQHKRVSRLKFQSKVHDYTISSSPHGIKSNGKLETNAFCDETDQRKKDSLFSPCWGNFRETLPSTNEYIRANYVNGFKLPRKFIACEAPTFETMIDYFNIIWNNACEIIIVFSESEKYEEEDGPYWPTYLGSKRQGKYLLTTKKIDKRVDYKKYYLEVLDSITMENQRNISLYHFTNWPEYGLPVNSAQFLALLLDVNAESLDIFFTQPYMGPIVVHSDAGVSRTATFCAVDISFEEWCATRYTNIFEIVRQMRDEDNSIILTRAQIKFIFQAVRILQQWDVLLKY
uniref:AsIV-cont00092-ORF1 n=1 Tax=Apophua simplicipes ichnovirus TaxID=1329648 RepID=S5DMN0_9VIRU|nr:AsIV-cont00092-ORF1 [Apophua simplicipes ichnovirus]